MVRRTRHQSKAAAEQYPEQSPAAELTTTRKIHHSKPTPGGYTTAEHVSHTATTMASHHQSKSPHSVTAAEQYTAEWTYWKATKLEEKVFPEPQVGDCNVSLVAFDLLFGIKSFGLNQ